MILWPCKELGTALILFVIFPHKGDGLVPEVLGQPVRGRKEVWTDGKNNQKTNCSFAKTSLWKTRINQVHRYRTTTAILLVLVCYYIVFYFPP